ncbi:DUF2971 domain-containing protein [Vibrio pacinii]|uniref:DUF2971 domain-containing protein n=1 Tax=Vibrio pacinii TaxID=170674 RepID=UPI00056F73E2|nr:DUF2971 domain-containing protein [Vibrio pacinii]
MDDLVYKYRSFSDRALEILINQELWLATPASLNDPFDCQIEYASLFEAGMSEFNISTSALDSFTEASHQVVQNLRVLSLSNSELNPLLWAHYAESHRGFCLGFDEMEFKYSFNLDLRPQRVEYSDQLPQLKFSPYLYDSDFQNKDHSQELIFTLDAFLKKVALTKPLAWSVEDESRIVTKHPMQGNVISFNPRALREVVFGLNMPESNKRTIKTLLAGEQWKHVTFYQIHKSVGSFELNKAAL